MLDVSELLKKVRRIEIVANRTVNDFFSGQYKSVFRGRGMEFNEVREYQPGDEIRDIDWNVTARAGKPFIKRFVEERELTIMLLVDVSASGVFGSSRAKMEAAVEMAATLMFSALKNNDKVGLLLFADGVVDYYRPRKGKANVLHLIRQLLTSEPVAGETNLKEALDYVSRIQKRRAVVFLLSDFLVPELTGTRDAEILNRLEEEEMGPLVDDLLSRSHRAERSILLQSMRGIRQTRLPSEQEQALSICARKHDLIALRFSDPREKEFPDVGLIMLQDAETGERCEVDTSAAEVRRQLGCRYGAVESHISAVLRRCRIDHLEISTVGDFIAELRQFFRRRERRH